MSGEEKAVSVVVPKWTKNQVALLGRTVAKGCNEDELKLFLYICKRSGLDPFLKQIFAYKNWDSDLGDYKMVVVTGIDGFRICGDRTQRVAGVGAPEFETDPNEPWHPAVARITIKMFAPTGSGEIIEFVGEARWKEFAKKKKDGSYMRQWSEAGGPFNQLAKCAEAQGWRKAAPNRTMGLLIREEAIDVDYEVESEQSGAELVGHPESVVSDSIQEGILIGYEPAKEIAGEKGKKAKTRPGHVLIEVPEGKVKLTFFHRPECFPDDAAATTAANERSICQFSFAAKGEYRNLATLVLKPKDGGDSGRDGSQSESNGRAASPQIGGPLPTSPDIQILLSDYRAEIESAEDVKAVAEILNRILKDGALSGENRVDLQARGKKRMDEVKK